MLSRASTLILETDAVNLLRDIFARVASIRLTEIQRRTEFKGEEVDVLIKLKLGSRHHTLICECRSNGQPRHVRSALLYLRKLRTAATTPILIVPFLSEETQQLCQQENVSFLDLHGNAHITFGQVFIERRVTGKPAAERRELRALFSPKSSRVLSVLLRDPNHSWRVAKLAEAANVSWGHVSNVRTALIERGWGDVSSAGLQLIQPDDLLETWSTHYQTPKGNQHRFYTTLQGKAFEQAISGALCITPEGERAVLSSFSAAQWLAPYARVSMHYLYAERTAIERLSRALNLTSPAKGENVIIITPNEDSVFLDLNEPAPGVFCTAPVRTYLDLNAAGERGREAAQFLRGERMKWHK